MLEETIVRGALQGLIDDSKIVDKLCKKLDCHRTEVLDKVNDNFALETDTFPITKEEVDKARKLLDEVVYKTQEVKSQADYALDEAKDAEDLASDLEYKFDHWDTLIREHEESQKPVVLEPEVENEDILKTPAELPANNIQTQ
jgi:hypothetical protein